ncbi:MAG: DUF2062 domain-containing protein [Nitrospiraceae bacterium]|nr:DUF2062 domain-containing protein [Nitrospiraceae bacterium]
MPSFRSLLKQVLHLRESPQRTALAFAIGVFIGFSPAYGLHTVMVLFCAWALGLNFLALMVGAFLNNPWTVVPILGATYWVGALLLGRRDSPSFDWHDLSFGAIYDQIMPYAMPFFLGGFVLSLLGAALAYPLAYYFVAKHRQSHPPEQPEPLPPPQDVR